MPLYRYTFIDTSTITVQAATETDARAHVDHLLAEAKFVDNGYKGKALASTEPGKVVDKYAEREAENRALRG